MKQIVLIIFILGVLNNVTAQNKNFSPEILISLNKTDLKDENTKDMYGFGIGVYQSFMNNKRLNIILGLEYNRTNLFKNRIYESHFSNAKDVTYNINSLSFPIGTRINIGSKIKFFLELGAFADIIINSSRKGALITYLPYENYQSKEFDEDAKLSNTFGANLGIGLRIPVSKYELVLKPDYKLAFNKLYSNQDNIYNRYFRLNIGLKF